MDLQLKGKTAIVTGATAGIGLAVAGTLVQIKNFALAGHPHV